MTGTAGLVLFYAVAALMGYGLMRKGSLPVRTAIFLAPAAGWAVISFFMGAAFLVGVTPDPILFFAIFAVMGWFLKDRPRERTGTALEGTDVRAAAVVLLITTGLFALSLFKSPHGSGLDVWAIWKLKARFLFNDPAHWDRIFAPSLYFSHPDYPLLYPLSLVWGWMGARGEHAAAAWWIAWTTVVSTAGLLWGSRRWGVWAALLLAGTPQWIGMASSLYADALFAYFILAASVVLVRALAQDDLSLWTAAGLLAGAAAFVKHEGWLFILSMVVSLVIWSGAARGGTYLERLRKIMAWAAGAAPLAVLSGLFKIRSGTASHFLSSQNMAALLDPQVLRQRLIPVLKAWSGQILHENAWVYGWFVLILMAVFSCRKLWAAETWPVWLTAIFLNAGYIVVYLQTPLDLEAHLATSLDRLMVHSFPLWVYLVFRAWGSVDDPRRVTAE